MGTFGGVKGRPDYGDVRGAIRYLTSLTRSDILSVMSDQYSLYDAKANLSKIVKQVREGGASVVITVHGEPAVEIRPYKPLSTNLDARWNGLVDRGHVTPAKPGRRDATWKIGAKKPGALKRFLADRDEP